MTGQPTPEQDTASAGDVARRLGVAVTTLRTWHQRYGLGPSHHAPGQHRRYTESDIARLDLMARLTARGLPAAEAARTALAEDHAPRSSPAAVRDGGGRTVPVGRADPAARGLARAAMRLDTLAMHEIIAAAIQERGVAGTWDEVLRPVFAGLGRRHAATGGLIEVEHLLSRCVSEALAAVPRPTDRARPPRLLLACAADEQHSLPLEALAAALAEHDVPSRLLGASVPTPALTETVRRTRPTAVVIWSHTEPPPTRTSFRPACATGTDPCSSRPAPAGRTCPPPSNDPPTSPPPWRCCAHSPTDDLPGHRPLRPR
nr:MULTISPECIES: MerR family transcriptional regulator [Pseudofrankia]